MAKQIIHWTYEEVDDEFYAQAIHVAENGVIKCFTVNEEKNELIERFPTKEQAIHFVEQLCKPYYYAKFRAGYELKYYDVTSDEWSELSEQFNEYLNKLVRIYNEEIERNKPFFQKLKEKLGSLFKLPK